MNFRDAVSQLKKCPRCLAVLNEILKYEEGGLCPYDICKRSGIAYPTIYRCVKKLKGWDLVERKEESSAKGLSKSLYFPRPEARIVYERAHAMLMSNGERKISSSVKKIIEDIPDINAEDLLDRVARKLKKERRF